MRRRHRWIPIALVLAPLVAWGEATLLTRLAARWWPIPPRLELGDGVRVVLKRGSYWIDRR
jgi:hypothetical protein